MNLAERLSEYSQSIDYADLGEDVIVEAKKRIIDSLGCAIGAFRESPVRIARKVAEANHSGGASTILGTESRTSPDVATFVNGLMVRYFDYNDTYLSKEPAHPSDNISACLAVGEREGSSGKDLLAAVVLAYEVQCRLCDAADIRHRGWDHVCYGLVSSALAAGKMMGLPRQKLAHAVNISLNAHIAMRQVRAGELSEWKGASFANAARNAVFSTMLAAQGMTGPSPIFEGEMGFFKQVSGPFELDTASFGGRGNRFKLGETYIKYFPAEYHAQSAIWAALQARSKIGSVDEISSVEVETHEAGYTILSKDKEKWAPSTKESADHSLPYMVGMTLLQGKIDNSTYSSKNIGDPRVLSFLKKIKVREDSALTEMYPRHIANRVTLRLKDGRTLTEQVDDPKGHPNNPMTREEVEAKFRRLTARFLKEAEAHEITDFVWNLEKRRVATLGELCVVR
ncbi:MAG: MmgE/PrpD family protein [Thaumarchaeota archaeon]|nr:MmgE/PrpD family protein [Nitrososphaerota archaeon]